MQSTNEKMDLLRVAGLGGLYNGSILELLPGQSATVGASSLATHPATRTRIYLRLAAETPLTGILESLAPEHLRLLYLGGGRLILENLAGRDVRIGDVYVEDRADLDLTQGAREVRFGFGERLVLSLAGDPGPPVDRPPARDGGKRARAAFASLLRPPGAPTWEDEKLHLHGEDGAPDSAAAAPPVTDAGPEEQDAKGISPSGGRSRSRGRGFRVRPAAAISALLHIVIVLGLFSQIRANLGRPRRPLIAEMAVERTMTADPSEPPAADPAAEARPSDEVVPFAPSTLLEEREAGPPAEAPSGAAGPGAVAGETGGDLVGIAGLGPGALGGPPGGGGGESAPASGRDFHDPDGAISLGLRWLMLHQLSDGSWGAISSLKGGWNQRPHGKREYRVAMTGLALLAFVGAGNTHLRGPFREAVQKAARYLCRQEQNGGSFFPAGTPAEEREMYGNGIATLALAELYRESRFPILKNVLVRETRFLTEAQTPYAGWRYRPRDRTSDTSVTGWQVLALRAVERAELPVNPAAFYGALAFIEDMTEPGTHRVGYNQRGRGSLAMTATGVLVRLLGKARGSDPAVKGGKALLEANLPTWPPAGEKPPPGNPPDLYYWTFGTLVAEDLGGTFRQTWNRSLRAALLGRQEQTGDAKGSWPVPGRWCKVGGRVMSTALAILSLESAYRR